jgi:hypothetical protein
VQEIRIGSIVRDTRDNRLFEVLEVGGSFGIGRPLDPADLRKNEKWALILKNLEVVLDESTEAFDILYRSGDGPSEDER